MIASIPLEHGLALAGVLFCLGLAGLMVRRNILFLLMSLEIMMNAAGLAFIVAGSRWAQADGQVMFILVITLAAAEAAVGLAMLLPLLGFCLLAFSRGRFTEHLTALIGVGSVGLAALFSLFAGWQFLTATPADGVCVQGLWQWLAGGG